MIEIIENEAAVGLAEMMIKRGHEPHSVLICGEKGLGKRTLARRIAAMMMCETASGKACGHCRQCRLIEKDIHPDLITVVSSETGNYKVEDIRTVTSEAYISPSEGRYKIYLIPDLDRSVQTLTQVQNIMLKLIEEPPESTVVMLTARSKELFLDTIISRTVHFRVEEVTPANAMAYLERSGIGRETAEEAVRRCGGNIGRCLEYAESEEMRRTAQLALDACGAVAAGDEYSLLLTLSQCGGKKADFITLLGFMQRIVRDSCRVRAGVGGAFVFSQTVCTKMGMSMTAERLTNLYDKLGDYMRRADANCLIGTLSNSLAAEIFE